MAQVCSLLWLFLNVAVFVAYGIDKGKAQRGLYRIPEKTLLLLTLFGGLGALLGGRFFHHKTQKWYFKWSWYLCSVLNLGLLYVIWRQLG